MASSTLSGAFISLLFLANALAAHGQDAGIPPAAASADRGLYLGVRVGYSNYRMTGSQADFRTTPYLVQYSGGSITTHDENLPVQWFTISGVLRKRLFKPLSLQVEATYLREGGSFKAGAGGSFVLDKTSYLVDYIQVPVLLNLQLLAVGPVAIHAQGGMALNLVVNGVQLDQPNLHPDNKFNNPDAMLATAFGVELTWQQQQTLFLLNFRYSNDLTDFYQREYLGTHYNLHSSGFAVTTGMLFGRP